MKRSSGVYKRWQKRFFAVAGHHLKYAKTEEAVRKAPKATVDLNALNECSPPAPPSSVAILSAGTHVAVYSGPPAAVSHPPRITLALLHRLWARLRCVVHTAVQLAHK